MKQLILQIVTAISCVFAGYYAHAYHSRPELIRGYVACNDDGRIVVKHIVFDLQQNATQFHGQDDLAMALQRVLCRAIL